MNNGNKNIGNSELIALANRRREQMKQAEAQKPQPAPAPQPQPQPQVCKTVLDDRPYIYIMPRDNHKHL